jgi:hypothetical protein
MTSSRILNLGSSTLLLALAALGVTSCAGQADVDRTQPDKIEKSIFFDASGKPKTYYYRETYVGVPPTSGWSFEGMQTEMIKVRFRITQNYLLGYRANDYAPGSQNPFTGTGNNTDTPVLSYAIKTHFDVKREYNPGTGEQTNVISENTSDRPWDQRQYMRVDWSTNLAAPPDFPMSSALLPPELQVKKTPNNWQLSETDFADPEFGDRVVVTPHYIDFVQKVTATPDYIACLSLYPGYDDGGPWGCGDAELKIRTSLMEVPVSNYEPLEYPDNYPILGKDGKPIQLLPGGFRCTSDSFQQSGGLYNGDDCSPAQVGGFSKFGFFRTVVQTYDRSYGATEPGRKFLANRWNIWEDKAKRIPKPIVYYTNVEFPDAPELLKEAQEVTKDWSEAMKSAVAAQLLTDAMPNAFIDPKTLKDKAAEQPEMVVLKQNSCNLAAVKTYLADPKHKDIADRVEEATHMAVADLDKTRLTQTCGIMEALTQKLEDTDPDKFTWQRNGDLRYSFFHWVDRPSPTGPLGYGPSSADPETGEIINANLYNYGAALDMYSQTSADAVGLLTEKISADDLLSGKTIADVLKETQQTHAQRDAKALTPEAKAQALAMLRAGGKTGAARLHPFPGGVQNSKFDFIRGTPIERQMMTPDILAAMLPASRPGQPLSPEDLAVASPANWITPSARDKRFDRFKAMTTNGCAYQGEFADDAIMGLAIDLVQNQHLSGAALTKEIRRLIFRGLADHEMGHTMGLRHNFTGSADALNYGDRFWQIRTGMPKEKWDANRISEYRYSTVMDYGSRFNSDIQGLGKYDMAAIRFGYAGVIDVMSPGARALGKSGPQLDYDMFLNDYTKLPTIVGNAANLADGGILRYQALRDSLTEAYQTADLSKGGGFATPERPYKFLSDEYIGSLDAKAWDFGANQTEIVDDTIDRFKNYFIFNAFKRGRLNWTIDAYMNRLMERYFIRFSEAYQFLYFFGDYYAGTDLADDLLKASIDSLNALGEVLQTPEPGEHCTTDASPDVMVVPNPSGLNACNNQSPAMTIAIPNAKPYYINFSDDYYYKITRAGSLYEKLAALITLTSTQSRFYRVDTFADSSKYSINFYSMFKDEMLKLLSGIIRNDPASYGGYVPTAGPDMGKYVPTPVVDLDVWGKAKAPMPDYMQPGVKRVDTPVNKTIRYYALGLALANLDSSWDSTLDISNYLAVTVKGSKDDVTYAPGTQVLEFAHPQSGLVYRAPQVDAKHPGIGYQIIQELNTILGTAGSPTTLSERYGYINNKALPDWTSAKAALAQAQADAQANTDSTKADALQKKYTDALNAFNAVDYLLGYRVDLLNDLRLFRTAFGY